MRIYLDNCCLNRLFDDQSQPRVTSETRAIRSIMEMVDDGIHKMLSSEVLLFEINRTDDEEQRALLLEILSLKATATITNSNLMIRSQELVSIGFIPMDAAHLACAEAGNADIFLTVDDRLMKNAITNAK